MDAVWDNVVAHIDTWRLEAPDHVVFWDGVASFASNSLDKYVTEKNDQYLQAAIYLSAAAVGGSTSSHPDRSRILSIFHQVFYHKYLLRRDRRDLLCALRALFDDVKLSPVGDKALIGPYASISDIYLERFNRWRQDEDFRKAVSYGSKAVKLFLQIALALAAAYESDKSDTSLHSGIAQMGGAISASYHSKGRIELDYMNAYANLLSIRAGRRYGSHDDIEAALYWARRAYDGSSEDDILRGTYAQNVSNRYYQRYKRKTKSLWDLDRAIGVMRSLPKYELETQGRASSLALELLDRYRDFGDVAALMEAVDVGRLAAQNSIGVKNSVNTAKACHIASMCLEELYGSNREIAVLEEALRYAGQAVTFNPPRNGERSDFSDTLDRLTKMKSNVVLTLPRNLCKNCSGLPHELFMPGSKATSQLFAGKDVISQLQSSIDNGCHLCALIKEVLDSSQVSKDAADEHVELLLGSGEKPSFWGMWQSPWTLWLKISLGSQEIGQLRVFNETSPSLSAEASERPVVVETETLTPLQFSMMNSWLDECMAQHPDCSQHLVDNTDFELPARLIAIHFDGTTYNLRLVDTKGWLANEHSYCALSHCWGPNPDEIPQTTKENLEARKQSIDFDILSKTFQEAVKVTDALNVQYLWIDSLCIVQHDAEDWGREASNMHLIYEYSIVTLVASASPDGKAGLCKPRDASHRTRMNVCQFTSWSLNETSKITVYPHLAEWENAVEAGPLSKRGWCFQERQLSRRMIHFTEMRILWECKSHISSEDQREMRERPVSVDGVMTGTGRLWDTRGGQDLMRALGLSAAGRQMYVPQKWCQIVEEYSRRRLTYARDKLPALAGLAHTVSEFLGGRDTYLAGLWQDYIARDLIWFRDAERSSNPNANSQGESDPFAPTWSWASYPGPISYHKIERFEPKPEEDDFKDVWGTPFPGPAESWEGSPLQFISAQVIPEGIDPLGRVNSGAQLVVSSVAVDITISEVYYMPRFHTWRPELKCYSMFKGPGISGIILTKEWTAAYDPREAIRHGYVCFDVNPQNLKLTDFVCLRLGKGVSRMDREADGAEKVDTGLLLEKVEGGEEYKRVGIFEVGPNAEDWITKGRIRTLTIV